MSIIIKLSMLPGYIINWVLTIAITNNWLGGSKRDYYRTKF